MHDEIVATLELYTDGDWRPHDFEARDVQRMIRELYKQIGHEFLVWVVSTANDRDLNVLIDLVGHERHERERAPHRQDDEGPGLRVHTE